MFCKHCGAEILDQAVICPKCGCATNANANVADPNASDKTWLATLLLCWFLGTFGIHRFYVGKTGTGVAQLLTMGGCGVWAIIDLVMIVTGSFKDAEGRSLRR